MKSPAPYMLCVAVISLAALTQSCTEGEQSPQRQQNNQSVVVAVTEEETAGRDGAAKKLCTGTVSSAYAKPSTESGFSCTTEECTASIPVGTKLKYECDDNNRCPVSTTGTNARANCKVGDAAYGSACAVSFSAVSVCQ